MREFGPDRLARMALSLIVDGGEPEFSAVVESVGPQAALARLGEGGFGEPLAQRAAAVDVEVVVAAAQASEARFVVPGDDEWPEGLADLRLAESVQRRGGMPWGLWVRGPGHLAALTKRSVAIVGSRACSAYGSRVASDLAAELAERGVTVISGGAFGIDAAAHTGALAVGGPSIAVLANGVDVAYPQGNRVLLDSLAREQLVVSELPPGAHPTRVRFLARNRLIAALSVGTVVVEAAPRSGARNTASWATVCCRPLMAVPGPVHSVLSVAPHLMIRNGQATLVSSAAEVLELISGMGDYTLTVPHGPGRATDRLDETQLAVFEAVPARRRATVGEIAIAACLTVPECLGRLSALEAAGLVDGTALGWRALPPARRLSDTTATTPSPASPATYRGRNGSRPEISGQEVSVPG